MRRSPAAAVLTALLLTACTGGGGDSATSASDADSGGGRASAEDVAAPAAGGTTGEGPSLTSGRVAPAGAVIRTAELAVRVDDVRAAADEAGRLARGAGGAVESEQRGSSDEDGTAVVVLRVPPRAFDATVDRLAALGDERSRQVGTEDVSDQVVDLDSRIATQRASVERVRALLDRARNLGEVVQVEGELTKRTADLESLEARLAALEEQVDLSTITLRLDAADGPVAPGDALGFGDGLRAGWDALVTVGRVLGVTAGALLPFTPLLLVAAVAVWRTRARRTPAT